MKTSGTKVIAVMTSDPELKTLARDSQEKVSCGLLDSSCVWLLVKCLNHAMQLNKKFFMSWKHPFHPLK